MILLLHLKILAIAINNEDNCYVMFYIGTSNLDILYRLTRLLAEGLVSAGGHIVVRGGILISGKVINNYFLRSLIKKRH